MFVLPIEVAGSLAGAVARHTDDHTVWPSHGVSLTPHIRQQDLNKQKITLLEKTTTIWAVSPSRFFFSSIVFFLPPTVSCCLPQSDAEAHYRSGKPVTRKCERLVRPLIICGEPPAESGWRDGVERWRAARVIDAGRRWDSGIVPEAALSRLGPL